jgi:hypothetical protein
MKGAPAMRYKISLLRLCGFLFAFLALSAMSDCPGPSTSDQGGGGSGGMGDSDTGSNY